MTFCKKLTIPFPYEQNLFHATDLFLYTLKTKRQIFLVFLGNKEETSGIKSINGSKGFINPAWKVSKYGVISSPYFPAFGLNSGKYRPEITPYLDTFHAVPHCVKSVQIQRFFWFIFSYIWTEYGDIHRISPYSVRMRENTDQKNLRIWSLFMQCQCFHPQLKLRRS